MNAPQLPALPMGDDWEYEPAEMRAYGLQCAHEQKERDAALAQELKNRFSESAGIAGMLIRGWLDDYAAAILAQPEPGP